MGKKRKREWEKELKEIRFSYDKNLWDKAAKGVLKNMRSLK